MLRHTVLNNKTQLHSDWLNEQVFNLLDPTFRIPETFDYEILEVTERYVARPDILSNDIYGDTLYSDLLCKLNGISNPFELNTGMLLVIPSPDCIMEFMKTPSIDECENKDFDLQKPVAKNKNEKRKANEAIVGDTRFRINRAQGIIIY